MDESRVERSKEKQSESYDRYSEPGWDITHGLLTRGWKLLHFLFHCLVAKCRGSGLAGA